MLISKIAAALMAFALALLAPATLAAAQTDDYVGGNPDEIDTGVPGGGGQEREGERHQRGRDLGDQHQ